MDNSMSPIPTDVLLSVRDLSVKFGRYGQYFEAVKKMSFDVGYNEIVGLIGESGSGKTTSAHSILGLVDGQPGIVSGSAI
jgi:ABC-type glutathione transport system ATPase component